jgi:uncharacterized protein YegL
MDFLFLSKERIRTMNQADRSNPMGAEHRVDSLKALILSLILAALGTILLLSILSRRTVVSASQGENTLNTSTRDALGSIAASPAPATVHITKTVEPTNPDTGGIVTICFIIGGLGPQRVDVVLAQDVSTSMNKPAGESATGTTRLEASQAAACAFVSALPGMDRAAVVSYSTAARLAQPLTTSKSSVIRTIDALTVTGGTNIGEGISVSHRELMTSPRYLTYTAKTIILLSDGIATDPSGYPGGPKEYARDRARSAATDTIKIYTIGFGSDADEELLQDLADIGGGRYFFAPDADVLKTIYMTIALELHNLVIVDLLPPGVDTDCSQWPPGWCATGPSGVTTITYPISNSLLISDPAVICFTATVNLDPGYDGSVNLPGSEICYQDSEGEIICDEFENPTVTVGGRKISGYVFSDDDANGQRDAEEAGVPDVVVQTSTGLTATTDISGSYVLRTSSEPAISVTFEVPSGSVATTPISRHVSPVSGTFIVDFGIYEGLCVQGKVFDDVNANGRDDGEGGVAGATVTVDGDSVTTGHSGMFFVCTPLNDGPITIVETDPMGYTSTAATGGEGVQVVDVNTLQIVSPVAGRMYGGNTFGDVPSKRVVHLPVVTRNYPPIIIVNGGFEDGWTGWHHDGELAQTVTSANRSSGNLSALLGDPNYKCEGGVPVGSAWVEQTVVIPSSVTSPMLYFRYNIFTQDKNPYLQDEYDRFDVKVGNTLVFSDARRSEPYGCTLASKDLDLRWQDGKVDLSAYSGHQITIRFENMSTSDYEPDFGWYNTWTFVDNVRIEPADGW